MRLVSLICPVVFLLFLVPLPLLAFHSFLFLLVLLSLLCYLLKNDEISVSIFCIPYLVLSIFLVFDLVEFHSQQIGIFLSSFISSVIVLVVFSQEKIQNSFLYHLRRYSVPIKLGLIGLLLTSILFKLVKSESFVINYLGKGQNYFSAYMAVFIPFIFSIESLIDRILSFFFVSLLLLFCILFSVRGSFLITILSVLILFLSSRKLHYKLVLGTISILIIASLFWFNNMHLESFKHFEFGRFYDVKISIKMFFDNIVTGIGTDQWSKEVFNYPLHKYYPVSLYYNKIVQPNIHNLHMKRLSEWGLFSVFYYLPIGWILLQNIFQWNVINSHRKKLVLAIIIIVIMQSIYRSGGHLTNHFSMIEFTLFATLGLLLKHNYAIKFAGSKLLVIFILFAFGIRIYSIKLPENDMRTPQSVAIKTRNELRINPNSDSILLNTKLMKFWFPNWNEALAIEMEYYYKNGRFDLFKDRVSEILSNNDNKPYLVYCWYYSIDYLYKHNELSSDASKYWEHNAEEITEKLDVYMIDRQRSSHDIIQLRGQLNQFLRRNQIEIE